MQNCGRTKFKRTSIDKLMNTLVLWVSTLHAGICLHVVPELLIVLDKSLCLKACISFLKNKTTHTHKKTNIYINSKKKKKTECILLSDAGDWFEFLVEKMSIWCIYFADLWLSYMHGDHSGYREHHLGAKSWKKFLGIPALGWITKQCCLIWIPYLLVLHHHS